MKDEEMAEEYAREWLYHIKDLELHHKEDDKPEYIRIKQAFLAGLKAGRPQWHYPSKGELPECDEKTQLIFYVNCYYEVGGETKIRKRTVLGFYKKSFMNDDIKLFVEKSKGYEDEHLPKDVIAWKEIVLPELPKEIE